MKSLVALIQREYLEHRGAFLYAPAVILGLLTLVLIGGMGFDRMRLPPIVSDGTTLRFFEIGFLAMAALWFVYLLASLFFYFADAFNADRRNNAMLFWKSMPVSDFKVLGAKMLTGVTIFPALIFVAMLLGGVLTWAFTTAAALRIGGIAIPDLGTLLNSAGQVSLFALVFMALALLWYAPFFAWVGGLSTLVGRWSIPLAFLIPGMAGVFENLLFENGPRGGYILNMLRERLQFGISDGAFENEIMSGQRIDAVAKIAEMLSNIDWWSMGGGLVFTVVVVYLASEYRRRFTIA